MAKSKEDKREEAEQKINSLVWEFCRKVNEVFEEYFGVEFNPDQYDYIEELILGEIKD